MSKYLDKTGLSAFWQKIKDTFAKKSDIPTDYVNTTSAQDISGVKTFKDTFYLDASTPYIIGKKNKIGMRAVDSTTGSNVGQFAVSNSSWDAYNGHFATMQAFDSDGNGHAIRISYNGPAYRVDSVDHPLALTENHYTKTESDAKYLPLAGGTMTGDIYIPSDSGLLYEDGSGWGFNDAGEPCLLNKQGRYLLIATTEFYDDYISYRFPEQGGTVVVKDENGYVNITNLGGMEEIAFGENDEIIIDNTGIFLNANTQGIKIDGSKVVTENKLKTINGQSIIGSGDITISGGGVSGNYLPLSGGTLTGLTNVTEGVEITFGEKEVYSSGSVEYPIVMYSNGCELNMKAYSKSGDYNIKFVTDYPYVEVNECGYYYSQLMPSALRILDTEEDNGAFYGMDFIGHGTSSSPSQYKLTFPEKNGTIALTSDVSYQHDIYIMPGASPATGVYISFTLNVKGKSTAYTTVAQVAADLYARGNTEQRNCVMATGKCSTSSSSFAGYVMGVYATNSTTLGVVYITTGGVVTTTTYVTSLLTNMRDKVN